LLLLGAFLTAFYTSRLLFLAFYSDPRMSREAAHHVHESPSVMTLPLWVLAVLTVVAGLAVGIPSERGTRLARFLEPVFPLHGESPDGSIAYTLLILSVIVVAAGFAVAWFVYLASPVRADTIGRPRTAFGALLLNAYYVDRLYDAIIVRPLFGLATFLAALGALVLLLVPRRAASVFKLGGLVVTLVTLLAAVPLYVGFDDRVADVQFEEVRPWMPGVGISYHLGVDGISLLLVLLTTFLMPVALASAWHAIEDRWKEFVVTMLILETG